MDEALRLLECLTAMFQPATGVAAFRVAVSPVNEAALRIPFVFAFKRNGIARSKRLDFGSKINVMGNQHSPSRGQSENKALMATAIVIVRQNFCDNTLSLNNDIASAMLNRLDQCLTAPST